MVGDTCRVVHFSQFSDRGTANPDISGKTILHLLLKTSISFMLQVGFTLFLPTNRQHNLIVSIRGTAGQRHPTQTYLASQFNIYIYIYIYAFSRRFYPKRLTLHSSYSFTFYQLLLSLGNIYFLKGSSDAKFTLQVV